MRTSEAGIELIKKHESFQPSVYLCPSGKPTIGYGHIIKPGESFNAPISESEACGILRRDLCFFEIVVRSSVKVPVNQSRFSALVSFAFNIGEAAFMNSTLIRMVNSMDFEGASGEFGKWVYATADGRKVKMNGLVDRRQAERELFEKEEP